MRTFVFDHNNIGKALATGKLSSAFEEQKSIDISLWKDGEFFKLNPQNVGGVVKRGTSRFGEVDIVVGTMEDITRILPPPAAIVPNWLVTSNNFEPQKKAPTKAKIAAAIAATEKTDKNPPSTSGYNLLSFKEVKDKYCANVSDDEFRIWTNYQKGRLFSTPIISQSDNGWSQYAQPIETGEYIEFAKKGLVAFNGKEWIPSSIYYAGAIYDAIKTCEDNKASIVAVIGNEGYQKQEDRLNKSVPSRLLLSAPADERLKIKYFDPFLAKFQITELSDGTVLTEPQSILDAWIMWLYDIDRNRFVNGSTAGNTETYEIKRKSFPKETSPEKKNEIKRAAQLDGAALFDIFLCEYLTADDQRQIEHEWNREYNGWKEINFDSVPVGLEISRWFGTGEIDPRKVLWDGVRFLSTTGSGLIAFDVGVGKTMCAILAAAQAMYTGQCKRPVIIVPDPTYAKWIGELVGVYGKDGSIKAHGILPQFKDRINDFGNLGVNYVDHALNNPPEDYTITFLNYSAIEKALGISKNVQSEMETQLFTILSQGLEKRDAQKLREDIDEMLGEVNGKTTINFDEMGWDYMVFDEAHNAKKVFTSVKGDVAENGERGRGQYALNSGTPSKIGLKTFVFSQIILRRNSMRNIVLLTATPFTNSPLEIYSMLAMVAYQSLEKRGIVNIKAFFDKFVLETPEMVVTPTGLVESKPVIMGFNNRLVLQNIVFSYMMHKTGEEAGVPRPIKVVYPRFKDDNGITLPRADQVDTALRPTADQTYWIAEIAKFANDEPSAIDPFIGEHYMKDGKLKGRTLLAVSMGRQVTISPLLLRTNDAKGNPIYLMGNASPTGKQFFDSCPKLQYTLECIRTIKQWHEAQNEPMSGIVIYMARGVENFPNIEAYMAQELGLKRSQIASIAGKIKKEVKEDIKNKFLEGDIKILLGSEAIQEGIDLQNKSTTLFNLTLEWNPTAIQQLEGRIYRQKNQHSYVRIVTPLLENSVDVFMFQKLEEKTSRINSIWYRAGRSNVLDVDSWNPAELKLGLMTDPKARAMAEIKNEIRAVDQKITVIEEYIKELSEASTAIAELEAASKEIDEWAVKAKETLERQLSGTIVRIERDDYDLKSEKTKDTRTVEALTLMLSKEATPQWKWAIIKRVAREEMLRYRYSWDASRKITTCEQQDKLLKLMNRLQKNVLSQHDMVVTDDLMPLIVNYEAQKLTLTTSKLEMEGEQFLKDRIAAFNAIREASDKKSDTIINRVKEFTKHNYLLSCLRDVHDCTLDEPVIRKAVKVIDISAPAKVVAPTSYGAAPAAPAPSVDVKRKRAIAKAKAVMVMIRVMNAVRQAA